MTITFLGTGTSTGIPQIGCNCSTCSSIDSKDKRLRASVLISIEDIQIIIDCGPDFRQQLIREDIDRLSGILITHEHYDHIGGLDDTRPLGNVKLYAEKRVINTITHNLSYCFAENQYPGVPKIELNEIDENSFYINGIKIEPIRVMHLKLPILGFKINKFAYLTDVKTMSEAAIDKLKDIDILVINALRKNEHISHLNLNDAIDISKKINAKKTFFTHLSHDMGKHEEVSNLLPENIYFAYDGLKIETNHVINFTKQ
jgi:phosphoribosyl 1,2-cyclic phosphate phosphodiesterase